MNYVETVYDPARRPFTDYPANLACYLCQRYGIEEKQLLLDVGAGRGEFCTAFTSIGIVALGIDRSDADLECESIPCQTDSFDVVFSKSVLEHFYYPERVIKEMYRVLKPGGLLLTMVPDWESCRDIYHEDFTHRTAFTLESLRDIQWMHGFKAVKVERFRQLPLLWSEPWLKPLSWLLGAVTPSFLRRYSKAVKFSKELMLLSSARKC